MAQEELDSEQPSIVKDDRKFAAKAFLIFLGALAFYFVSLVLPSVWVPAVAACSGRGLICYDWIGPIALTGALVAGLIALVFTFKAGKNGQHTTDTKGTMFPQGETVMVLIWLIALFIFYLYFLLKVIVQETIDGNETFWLMILDHKMVLEATVAFLAAGLGSTVSTTFSYLRHASTDADWKGQYTPWYILRPLQGSVLGVIFYWLLKGGILAVLPAQDTHEYLDLDLNGLSGVCALVGMFSRRAMIKLRETFKVIFSTDDEDDDKKDSHIADPADQE